MLSKNVKNKECAPKFVNINEKIRMILPLLQFSKFGDYI